MSEISQARKHKQRPARTREPSRLRANLRASLGEGTAFGGMVGLGETYLPAFALAIGLGEVFSGLVASVPLIIGGIMQLVSPTAVRLLGSHKRWVVVCAGLQALTFVPLLLAALWGSLSGWALLLIASVYWGSGLATGPAWNYWIGTVVPRAVRATFFALRTRGQQVAIFVGLIVGGVALDWASVHDSVLTAYAVLFLAAAVCRLLSTVLLGQQPEPIPLPDNMRLIPWRQLKKHLAEHGGGRLMLYLVVVQGSVQIAGPYFTPFMFEKLELNYAQFVFLISVAFLTKAIALPLWGRYSRRMGALRLLWLGGIGLVPLSGCWIFSQNLGWLTVVQLFGGIAWAAYELAFFLLFFESIPEEERTSLLTYYNLVNSVAWVIGALIGGVILWTFATSTLGYMIVFAASSCGRLVALVLLSRVPATDVQVDVIGVRSVSVRPNAASLDLPVLPSLPDQVHSEPAEVAVASSP